jgi:hypothetical protein
VISNICVVMEHLLNFVTSQWGIGIICSLTASSIIASVKRAREFCRTLWYRLTRYRPQVPRETIRAIPNVHETWWAMGSMNGKPTMQVVARWHVTNIINAPVFILRAFVLHPRTEAQMVLVRHPDRNVYGHYPIEPGATTEASTNFWIMPPIRKEGEHLKAAIVLVDQYGNEHKVNNVIFRGPAPRQPNPIGPPGELIHSIQDPLEKEVAAVLKAEVTRYSQCGRRVGGLGSVQTTYQNQTVKGIGSDWRESDSPKAQLTVADPDNARIESDNADALQKLYSRLGTEEQPRFVEVLLKRLSRDTEYAPVGYLILLVLFRIGHLPEVLQVAKSDLQNDGAYGFSDFQRLLDGLLRLKHPMFTTSLLDEVERFIEGIHDEFVIHQRLAAIRAHRVALGQIPERIEPPQAQLRTGGQTVMPSILSKPFSGEL